MSTLQNKIDFAVVFSVNKANPNGDPLDGNRPRINYNGYGRNRLQRMDRRSQFRTSVCV